jgi:hypothetical protein
MKKVLFASLFAACASIGLSSCMNGDYDANPNGTNSGANPLNTGGTGGTGGGGATGNITCKVDGTTYTFSGKWGAVGSQRVMSGSMSDNGTGRTAGVTITNYTGAKTYNLATEGSGNYSFFPMSNPSDATTYSTASVAAPGTGTVTVTSDGNDRMKGTFSFTASKLMGSGNPASVTVTDGTFDLPK